MTKTIVVTIDGKATTYEQPDGHENAGRVFELARAGLREEHLVVMDAQREVRRKEHAHTQKKIGDAAAAERKAKGLPEPEPITLTVGNPPGPNPRRVRGSARG